MKSLIKALGRKVINLKINWSALKAPARISIRLISRLVVWAFNVFIRLLFFAFSWRGVKTGGIAIVALVSFIWLSNIGVQKSSAPYLYSNLKKIPKNNVGIVLGTTKRGRGGRVNPFFRYRMEATAQLYKSGKIRHILVSGDNSTKHYDESSDMKQYLVKLGVPSSRITMDYAGFRTLDSMVRAKKVFGQKSITVISQKFHNERAVFIGRHHDMEVIAFNARDVDQNRSKKTHMREIGAKFKAILDLYILGTDPKFLGDPVHIPNHLAAR